MVKLDIYVLKSNIRATIERIRAEIPHIYEMYRIYVIFEDVYALKSNVYALKY